MRLRYPARFDLPEADTWLYIKRPRAPLYLPLLLGPRAETIQVALRSNKHGRH
jgi:hypothetical protein